MQERELPRAWSERRSTERQHYADSPSAHPWGCPVRLWEPTATVYGQRGVQAAMALGVLSKPNRSRKMRSRLTSPSK